MARTKNKGAPHPHPHPHIRPLASASQLGSNSESSQGKNTSACDTQLSKNGSSTQISENTINENIVVDHEGVENEEIVVVEENNRVDENCGDGHDGDDGDERESKSVVWKDFDKVTVKDKGGNIVNKALCKHCKKTLSRTVGHGTSHLKRHLMQYCKKKKRDSNDIRQLMLAQSSKEPGSQLKAFKFDQDVSRKNLAKLVICAELSFRFVEHLTFVNFVKSLQPLFKPVGRLTVRNDCMLVYREERGKLHSLLKELNSRVSFTSDMWTSNQKLGYMTLTAHYIDEGFVLRKKIINFKKVAYPHTSFAVSELIWICIVDWELDDRVLALTLDNATTNDSVATKLKANYGKKMLLDGVHLHIRCCAHILNIMVQDGLHVLVDSIENIRSVVKYVNTSPSRLQIFNELATQKRLPKKGGLTLDVPTRWNSTHDMLVDALVYKDVFMMYVQEHASFLNLTNDDWNKVDGICKFLKCFVDATHIFSGFKYPTSNLYFKEVWNIRNFLLEEAMNQEDIIRRLAKEMQIKFNKYWKECNKFLCIANILDPRFKLAYICFSYMKAYGEVDGQIKIDEICKIARSVYEEYERETNRAAAETNQANERNSDGPSSFDLVGNKRKHDLDYMQWWATQQKAKRPKMAELEMYLEDPTLASMMDTPFNVLDWWKQNATLYPILSKMARDFLAVPVSTVSSESAFSTSGRIIDTRRSRLAPETIEGLICAQDWLRDSYQGPGDDGDSDAEECITEA